MATNTTPFDAVWRNNLVFANTVNFSGTSDSTGANGNVSADPRFVNAASGNFHLGRGSAAIDAGTSVGLSLPPTDFDGAERNQDGDGDGVAKIDIGAFEAAPPEIQASIPVPVDSRLWLMIAALAIMAMARQRLSEPLPGPYGRRTRAICTRATRCIPKAIARSVGVDLHSVI